MTKTKCVLFIGVAVLLFISPCFGLEWASDERELLRGLKGVFVAVDNIDNAAEVGLSIEVLKTDIELKLRLAGIKVLSQEEFAQGIDAILYVYIIINYDRSKKFAHYSLQMALIQSVVLLNNTNLGCYAKTWDVIWIGGASRKEVVGVIRNNTKDRTDEFINKYLAVNPRQIGEQPKDNKLTAPQEKGWQKGVQ